MDREPAHSSSKRGRVGEGRPTLYTPELANRLADHIAAGLTDEEAAALEDISGDCINRWRKGNREVCEAAKKAEAQRLRRRLTRIDEGRWVQEPKLSLATPALLPRFYYPRGRLTHWLAVQAITSAITETWSAARAVLFT